MAKTWKTNGTSARAFMAGFSSDAAAPARLTDDTLVRLTPTPWTPATPARVADVELFLEMSEAQSAQLRRDLVDRRVSFFGESRVEVA